MGNRNWRCIWYVLHDCSESSSNVCLCVNSQRVRLFPPLLCVFLHHHSVCSLLQVCDDTVLLERIIGRGENFPADERREDDNFQTALQRLRTFHKYHYQTMEWLRAQHVPTVNLDCSGPPDSVWQQLKAIGRLMRPAVKLPGEIKSLSEAKKTTQESSLAQDAKKKAA